MDAFTGIWPALISPIDGEGTIKEQETCELVELLLSTGIGGLYVCGGTGEGILLSHAQRRRIAELVVETVAGRVPVMVHVGALTTGEAVELAQDALAAGCDAISAVPPFYYGYSFAAIEAHYKALAAVATKPLYVYYIPGSTGNPLTRDQLLALCALDGIAGFKFTCYDLHFLSDVLSRRDPRRTTVLSGPDQLYFVCQALGVDGAIGTTYNVAPRLFNDIRSAVLAGEVETARELQFRANRVIDVLMEYGAISGIKAAVRLLGIKVGQGVLPMPPIVGAEMDAFAAKMEAAGLYELRDRPALYPYNGDAACGKLA